MEFNFTGWPGGYVLARGIRLQQVVVYSHESRAGFFVNEDCSEAALEAAVLAKTKSWIAQGLIHRAEKLNPWCVYVYFKDLPGNFCESAIMCIAAMLGSMGIPMRQISAPTITQQTFVLLPQPRRSASKPAPEPVWMSYGTWLADQYGLCPYS
jgi:hypothetical protein